MAITRKAIKRAGSQPNIRVGQRIKQKANSLNQSVAIEDELLSLCTGSENGPFSLRMINQVAACVRAVGDTQGDNREVAQDLTRSVAAALLAFEPRDEIEGMLAAQAVALHEVAMSCFRRAALPDQPWDVASRLRRDGAKLVRTFTDVLAALDRKRGKGQQHIRVERVVVHEGGQAIVGAVSTSPRAGTRPGGEG